MQESNTPPIFDVDALETSLEWFERKGRRVFRSYAGVDWFIRQHRDELLKSGIYFPGRGSAPTRVGPGFGELVIQIMQREAASKAVSA